MKGYSGKFDIGFVDDKGYTYAKQVSANSEARSVLRIALADLQLVSTALLPAPYPDFLNRYFNPTTTLPFMKDQIEKLIISTSGEVAEGTTVSIGASWLE
ncbi:hypothetical protein D3C78_1371910 [compost metagenome]